MISYDYFGNTSLRVKNLLYNFEAQILLFDELFKNASNSDVWANDSALQIKYLELLERHNLLDSKHKTTHLGTKDARVKSAPLEDYNLINRKQKLITAQGYELLGLIKNESYKINNEFLQIDLISLFFLKASLNFLKSKDLAQKYLAVFRAFNGELSKEQFMLLPLINNFDNVENFIESIKRDNTIKLVLQNKDSKNLENFLKDLESKSLKLEYFKTAKGEKTASSIISALQDIFVPFIESKNIAFLESLLLSNIDSKYSEFKKLYLSHITNATKKSQKLKDLESFCNIDLKSFGIRFYNLIFKARILNNLQDYCDLNRRYLNLTGIFEFDNDKISVNEIFKIILRHSHFTEILQEIATSKVSTTLLSNYFNNKEFIESFKKYGISSPKDLKNYKKTQDILRLQNLIKSRFSRENLIKILSLFNDRKNDNIIFECVTKEASIPTIFEYIIAIAWHYIDGDNVDRILNAGLSLDSNMLPKSHAIGGNADFTYTYPTHTLMIEVTLTDKINQRRAEMESVSRHLGNLLLSLESSMCEKSYAIFIAPHLDKNVINDFRSRIFCYFENDKSFIKGMKILPLSLNDITKILESKCEYALLHPRILKILNSPNDFGSKWYENEIKAFIDKLNLPIN